MMLIIRIQRDGITIRDSAKSLGKSASWGYKWHERYLEVGFDRLADMPRSGRPTMVSKADLKRIRKNACRKTAWTGREMQEYIQQQTGVKYNLIHVRYILRSWGDPGGAQVCLTGLRMTLYVRQSGIFVRAATVSPLQKAKQLHTMYLY